jgi:hypothetical protein
LPHDFEADDRFFGGPFRDIDQVEQEGSAFDMPEKLKPQSLPAMSTLDEAWNIGDDYAPIPSARRRDGESVS